LDEVEYRAIIRKQQPSDQYHIGEPETYVVVAVVGRVVVAITATHVLRVVVPATAAHHTVRSTLQRLP